MREDIRSGENAIEKAILSLRVKTDDIQNEEGRTEYQAVRETTLRSELNEDDFSSELLYRWYETIRRIPYAEFAARAKKKIIVSMTSHPARIQHVPAALETIFGQSRKADRVILWLAEEQFPEKEAVLPESLLNLTVENKLEIRWCEDLKPHKKYFYILQEETEELVVTIDDDLVYPADMLELLYLSYIRHPHAVSAMRVHCIAISTESGILPYRYWIKETDAQIDEPSMRLFATTGAGTLYPPGSIGAEWFDKAAIGENALIADDLWVKAAEAASGTQVVLACRNRGLKYVPGSQNGGLWEQNREQNDEQIRRILNWAKNRLGQDIPEKILSDQVQPAFEQYCQHAADQIDKKNKVLKRTYAEKTKINSMLKEERKKSDRLKKAGEEMRVEKERLESELTEIKGSKAYRLWQAIRKPVQRFRK